MATVPVEEWDAMAGRGFDAVWLMGVWERSPAGIAVANRNQGLLEDFRRVLSDYCPDDNVGSPYCVRNYIVDVRLGGPEALAVARAELARRGLKLVLDFVPNHVAPDHPWVDRHPEFLVPGTEEEARSHPASFIKRGGRIFACGRDPHYPAWPDVLQLNGFHPGLRQAVKETLGGIASQCDGVRCDMAMLLMSPIFERTWGGLAGQRPATEYWVDMISAVKKTRPDFLFIAEAYWDLEWELQQQGFDYCYDKRLYDRMEHGGAECVRLHLCADPVYQGKLVRFIENHDEPRAGKVFPGPKGRAAAVIMATIPGGKLYHEGQFEGRQVKLPVFLGRRPDEPVDSDLQGFYRTLLNVASLDELRNGTWLLCDLTGWPDNETCRNLLAWCWSNAGRHLLIVVNYSAEGAQGLVRIHRADLKGRILTMMDLLTGERFDRSGNELYYPGLYVNLPPWGCHVMQF